VLFTPFFSLRWTNCVLNLTVDQSQNVEATPSLRKVPELIRLPHPEGPGSDHRLQSHRFGVDVINLFYPHH
jgi:hypothetical protein